jgi:hypothetical protein
LSKKESSDIQLLEDQVIRYRRVLEREVASHRLFSRIALVTGAGLVLGGIAATYYYASLGWLLVIVGILRLLNTLYDLQRKDDLDRKLEQLDREFGRSVT